MVRKAYTFHICSFINSFPDESTTFILLEYHLYDSLYEWCLQQVDTEQPVQFYVDISSFQ